MLTFEDCLAFARLTEDEVDAIAVHEHVPEMVALELGSYLCRSESGELRLKRMILDDIEAARAAHDAPRAAALKLVLRRFCESHGHELPA